jgi:pyroglutamyl-peptidase
MLVTGFGPFLGHESNPSGILAEEVGGLVLEVSYRAVDAFLDGLDPASFDTCLAIGLSAKGREPVIETVGRNWVGSVPDVTGMVCGPGVIEPAGPPALASTLVTSAVTASVDAGSYLCNYVLYRALRRFPEKRIGFLHVPAFSVVPFEEQIIVLRAIIAELEVAACV